MNVYTCRCIGVCKLICMYVCTNIKYIYNHRLLGLKISIKSLKYIFTYIYWFILVYWYVYI
jgi:hypothetical protein